MIINCALYPQIFFLLSEGVAPLFPAIFAVTYMRVIAVLNLSKKSWEVPGFVEKDILAQRMIFQWIWVKKFLASENENERAMHLSVRVSVVQSF